LERLMTSLELSKYFSVTQQTIANWRKEGMPSIKIGRYYRFDLNKVMEWLEERK